MADNWKMPALELGEVEAIAPDGTEGICYDSAIIFFKDEKPGELSIEVECPAALRIARGIVLAVNNHEPMLEMLREAALQLEYMQTRTPTGTSAAVLARIQHMLALVAGSKQP